MTRQEALRRISSALRAAGHERDKKEYVLWPPRERWPGPHSPFCRHVDAACDELGLYPTPRAVLQERDCRPGNWVVEVYVSERIMRLRALGEELELEGAQAMAAARETTEDGHALRWLGLWIQRQVDDEAIPYNEVEQR